MMSDKALTRATPPQPEPLSKATRRKVETIAKSIDEAKVEAERISKLTRRELEEVAEKYSKAPSEVLAGIIGGVLGGCGGTAVSMTAGAMLVVSGPLGLALGVAAGILIFRGPSFWRLERATHKLRGSLDLIKAELATLPPEAPKDVKDQLWQDYGLLMHQYTEVACQSIAAERTSERRRLLTELSATNR
jgi:hypothetical protein